MISLAVALHPTQGLQMDVTALAKANIEAAVAVIEGEHRY